MMIITNIINVVSGEQYGDYIISINVINSILNRTYKNSNLDNDKMKLCVDLLTYQLGDYGGKTYPKYVVNLLDKYCKNLKKIMIFWDLMENMTELRDLFCINTNEFFDIYLLLKLFPNIEQIECYNPIFVTKAKIEIKKIIKYILQLFIHQTAKLALDFDSKWNLHQDDQKVILYKNGTNIYSIKMRFDEVNQGDIAQIFFTRSTRTLY